MRVARPPDKRRPRLGATRCVARSEHEQREPGQRDEPGRGAWREREQPRQPGRTKPEQNQETLRTRGEARQTV